jgi:hypothetical protein
VCVGVCGCVWVGVCGCVCGGGCVGVCVCVCVCVLVGKERFLDVMFVGTCNVILTVNFRFLSILTYILK